MHVADIPWQQSPSGTVWRKRFHLVGPAEAGQVTSLVRYEPESSFPAHDHPDGEEILVLDGVFSDEHGDYPAGSYLLNPEGFRHAPFSKAGCLLFVKLRQYPGRQRPHVALQTRHLEWTQDVDGASVKLLFDDSRFPEQMQLLRWSAGERQPARYPGGAEFLILSGSFEDENGCYERYDWLRIPAGGAHQPRSQSGCELYVKVGGAVQLRGSEAEGQVEE